jgi:hypothetical protein
MDMTGTTPPRISVTGATGQRTRQHTAVGRKLELAGRRRFTLPDFVAKILANPDASAAEGWLPDDSRTLEKLIGRPTTPVATVVEAALKAAQ